MIEFVVETIPAKIYGKDFQIVLASTKDWWAYQSDIQKAMEEVDADKLILIRDKFLLAHGLDQETIDKMPAKHSAQVIDIIGGVEKK